MPFFVIHVNFWKDKLLQITTENEEQKHKKRCDIDYKVKYINVVDCIFSILNYYFKINSKEEHGIS